jgi:drug/metabolite transporter (DMT)-like permease
MAYIAAIVFSLQRVGAASLFALVVTGQLLTALLFDHLGLLGLMRSPLTLSRLAGALLLVAGAYLLNRKEPSPGSSLLISYAATSYDYRALAHCARYLRAGYCHRQRHF